VTVVCSASFEATTAWVKIVPVNTKSNNAKTIAWISIMPLASAKGAG
jgi:hypothetical protein